MGLFKSITNAVKKVAGSAVDATVGAAVGIFTGGLSLLGDLSPSSPDLGGEEQAAYERERARLKEEERKARAEEQLLQKEGVGVKQQADVTLGADIGLNLLTPEDQQRRATGRSNIDTGLIL